LIVWGVVLGCRGWMVSWRLFTRYWFGVCFLSYFLRALPGWCAEELINLLCILDAVFCWGLSKKPPPFVLVDTAKPHSICAIVKDTGVFPVC
jgi:hypothetical protein